MAFSEIELQRIKKIVGGFCTSSSPAHLRDKLYFDYDLAGQVITLVEVRPQWNDPKIIHRRGFARIRWIKTSKVWRLYWMRATLKWESYEPMKEARHLDAIIKVIENDDYCCFFG